MMTSKKREFLKELIRGRLEDAKESLKIIESENKPEKRMVALSRNGKIIADGKEFTEKQFKVYLKKLRNVYALTVTVIRTRKRTRAQR